MHITARSTLLLNYTTHQVLHFNNERNGCQEIKGFDCPIKVGDKFRKQMHVSIHYVFRIYIDQTKMHYLKSLYMYSSFLQTHI